MERLSDPLRALLEPEPAIPDVREGGKVIRVQGLALHDGMDCAPAGPLNALCQAVLGRTPWYVMCPGLTKYSAA